MKKGWGERLKKILGIWRGSVRVVLRATSCWQGVVSDESR